MHIVTSGIIPSSPADLASPLRQVQVVQRLCRQWLPYLANAETTLLLYLIDNSVFWQRTTLRATLEQMQTGTSWLPSCGFPYRSLVRTMGTLIGRGLVKRTPGRNCNSYEINLQWEPQMSIGRMAVPKRLQAATQVSEADPAVTRRVSWIEERSLANRDSDMSTGHLDASDYGTQETPEPAPKTREPLAKLAPSTCQTGTPLKEKVLKESLYPSLPQAISIGTTVGTTMQTGRTGSPAPIRPVTPIRASQPALPLVRGTGQATPGQAKPRRVRTNDMIWREAHVDVFPGLPIRPMPAASRAILAQMQERMTKQGVDWATYFDWCIRNWRHVTATQFGWMNKSPPPMFPDLRFFLTAKLHEGFADAYARRQERERLDMTGGEAGVYARALAAGQTHDQALLEIGKQRAAAAAHGDLDKTRKHLERSLAALEQDRRALRKPAMVVPPAPPPPGPGEHVRLGGPVAPLQEPTQEMLDCLHTDHVFLAWDAE